MAGLAMALRAYASDCDHHYPPPDKWCDLLKQWQYVEQKKMFICPRAFALGDEGPCHYAINPDASAACPPDTVLLFPTKGGWNQFGGADMLTTENHQHVCFVAFVDKIDKIRPVNTNKLGKLKWKADALDMSRIKVGPRNTVSWEDARKIIREGNVKAVSQSHSRHVLIEMQDGTVYRTTEPGLDDVLRLLKETGRDEEIQYATE
jgi:hypothetical protein